MGVKTELLGPAPGGNRWRDQLASLDESARKIELTLVEALAGEDAIRSVAMLAVPDLADYCGVEVMEGERAVRNVFVHRDPKVTMVAGSLMEQRSPLHTFAEGRRALAGKPAFMRFSPATFRRPGLGSPAMRELTRLTSPHSGILLPFVVLGSTVAVAGFFRSSDTGLVQAREDLLLAEEVARRALIRQAGLSGARFTGGEDARLRRVDDYIRAHLGASVSLEALAREAALSRFHLLRLFKERYGETPFKRLARLRMQEAQRRLASTNDSVTEIASACAYENGAHFASAFRRVFGISPTAFRRMSR